MNFSNRTLENEETNANFMAVYYPLVFSNARSLTRSHESAEQLTNALFNHMSKRYQHMPLPSNIELLLMAQLNLLFAQGSYKTAANADIQPSATHAASDDALSPSQTAPVHKEKPPKIIIHSKRQSVQVADIPSQPSPRRSRSASRKDVPPVQAAAFQPLAPSQPFPRPESAVPSANVQPGVVQILPMMFLPYGAPQGGVTPLTYSPIQQQFSASAPVQVSTMPVQAFFSPQFQPVPAPPQSASVQGQASSPSAQPAASQTPPSPTPAAKSVINDYNPALTELWTADNDLAEPSTAASTAANAPAASPVPSPGVEDGTSQRSIFLTIFNTFLFIVTLASLIFLLYQLNVLPKLF